MDAPKVQTAVVTGASRGIGVALTRALALSGYKVHAIARSADALESEYQAETASGRVLTTSLDITDERAVDRFFGETFPAGVGLDLLFNNAGRFASLAPIWDSDAEAWWSDIAVNIRGTYLVTRAALEVMMRADSGIIINMAGGKPLGGSGYAVSKAGVSELTHALNNELRHVGSKVLVYSADPGLVDTHMSRSHLGNPFAATWLPELVGRLGSGDTRQPGEIASKLIAQLPFMSLATSGGFFNPDTPTGTFA